MRRAIPAMLLITLISLGGCAGLTETEQRTLTGGTAGAAGGAVIGAITGDAGLGAAIGGTGLLGGFLFGQHEESERQAYQEGYHQGQLAACSR
jgi:osmotically inducible lipoprotein OsmB